MIQALGGVEGILEHTLFKGTYFLRMYLRMSKPKIMMSLPEWILFEDLILFEVSPHSPTFVIN